MATSVFLNILAPILLMVAMGALVRRKFNVDIGTLSKINLYLFVPAFIFSKVSTSRLPWADMGGIVLVTVVQALLLGAVVLLVGRLLRVDGRLLAVIALSVMFYNSGNYGLPLAELAYPGDAAADGVGSIGNGGAVQAFVLATQNLLTFTLGLGIAAWAGTGQIGRSLITIIRLPMLPALGLALVARWYAGGDASNLPRVLVVTADYLAQGLVPVALVTLGAQLATNPRWPRWKPVGLVVALRLIYAPVQMAVLLWLLHRTGLPALDLWPWPAEVMILTAAVPTALNTLLLTLEVGGDPELSADCVFWTTILSAGTITGWLLLVKL